MFSFFRDARNFFGLILDFIKTLVSLLRMLIDGIVTLVQVIPNALSYLHETINFVPDVIKPFILITITGSILFLILGRSSGKEN